MINGSRLRVHGLTPWGAFAATFLVSLSVYVGTLAPTVTLEWSGSLVTAADYLGVANSPGFPSWTLLAWCFQRVFGFVTYHGHPNPAWGVAFMSAFFGALTCGLAARLICASCRELFCGEKGSGDLPAWVSGVSAGLILAFTPAMWSQSVIAETHTLNAFVLMLFLWYAYLWIVRGIAGGLYATSFLLGLGLTTSHTFLFVLPPFAFLLWSADRRDFFAAAGLLAVVAALRFYFHLVRPEAVLQSCVLGLGMLLVLSVARGLSRGPRALGAGLAMLAGVSLYLYMAFASEQNPPINWGYARVPEGFLHMITRGQYERVVMLNPLLHPGRFAGLLVLYLRGLIGQFTVVPFVLGLVPLVLARRAGVRARRWWFCVASVFLSLSALLLTALRPQPDLQTLFIARVYLIPSFAVFALGVGYGLFGLLGGWAERNGRARFL